MIWPPPAKALEGSKIRLEPLRADHEPALLEASRDERIWEWMNRDIGTSDDAFSAWFATRLANSEAGAEWCFANFSRSDGRAIGSSSYLAIRPEHDGLEVGWTWLNPSAWRTGANREQKLLMLGFAFEELGAIRVEFKTDARNDRSRAALAALPAQFEGIFRRHMVQPGEIGIRDSAYYSITDQDWPEVKARLEAGTTTTKAAS